MLKSDLLKKIINYYLESGNFNGLPNYQIDESDINEMESLIKEGLIEAISGSDVLNPHIRGFDLNLSIEHQIINAKNTKGITCFYPTEKALKGVEVNYQKPYTAILQSGRGQFDIIYFDIEILERYINNPKFLVMDNGYRGKICTKDDFYDEDVTSEYIKDYGMAYMEGEKLNRAIAVFVTDLAKLSPKIQMMWKGFELENQNKCKVGKGFIKNLIMGEWVTEYWIFHALLDEMIIINKQCDAMEIPKLFSHTYGTSYTDMPEGYRNILLPTLKNYYDFVLVLEKLVVHNISIKTFQKDTLSIKGISRKDSKGNDKGSIAMLAEWLKNNTKTNFDIDEVIIKPIKFIRKIRQVPAHELTSNVYNIDVFEKQKKLMMDTYGAIRIIRILFMRHPLTKDIEVPNDLLEGNNIIFY